MIYLSIFLAVFLAVYFYDGICNISENMIKRESKNTIGIVLIIVNLVMMVVLYFMRKETTQKMELEEISDPYQNILFYGLCLLFGVANLLF